MTNTGSPFDPEILVISIITLLLQTGLLAFSITLFIVHRKRIREFWAVGLILGAASFLFNLPIMVAIINAMDIGSVLPAGFDFMSGLEGIIKMLAIAFTVIGGVLGIGIAMFHYVIAAAEWDAVKPQPFPLLMRTGEKAWAKIGIAALAGAALSLVSMIVARALNVGLHEILESNMDLIQGFQPLPGPVLAAFTILYVSSAAISEEVLYRGALLGFLQRLGKKRAAWIILSAITVSLFWAFMHVFNTDNPAFKLTQIFLLGCILSEFTRRWSLESAIAAHLSFNVMAVLLAQTGMFA